MRKSTIVILRPCVSIIFILTTASLYGQTIKKCDISILRRTNERMGYLDKEEIGDFLYTFGYECQNNIEYSEWSNELIFSLLDVQTELTLRTLETERRKIDINKILADISTPSGDPVNLEKIITKIEHVRINKRFKKEILISLNTAIDKSN